MSNPESSAAPAGSGQTNYLLYVGTYDKGVYAFRYNAQGPKFEPLGLVGEVTNPSFVTADPAGRHLFAVSELEGNVKGDVVSFSINRTSGSLQFINSQSSEGVAPCHLAVDHTSKMLVVANYGSGSVAAFPIGNDGRLGKSSALMQAHGSSVNPKRQEGPHAHEAVISADNTRVYVPDLGLDQIHIYRLDPSGATLMPNNPPFAKEQPGRGPRHIAFSPDGKFAYVVNELESFVAVYAVDSSTGDLKEVQSVSTLPEHFSGENAPAEIEIDREGKFVYASNRGPGTIAVFAVDPSNGTLRQVQVAETGGTWPRGFLIDPSGQFLISGDQKKNDMVIFRIDPASGRLTPTGKTIEVPSPVSFVFVPAH